MTDATTNDRWKNKRVGVLSGGPSAEAAVSRQTGAGVLGALVERGYDVVELDWRQGESVASLIGEGDVAVVWIALHGTYGEDGSIQGLLACEGIPYTGSDVLASALAMDKISSKRIFAAEGLPTPEWFIAPSNANARDVIARRPPPLVVKPASEGSSVGVTIVGSRDGVDAALETARSHRGPVLVERFIAGKEIHVGILEDTVLGSIEVRPAVEFYDYNAKYERDDTEYLIPTTLDKDVIDSAEAVALAAYRALGCRGHGRVDLRIDEEGRPWLLEVNTLPGMTSHSLLPKIAGHVGIDYERLCLRILATAAL